MIKFQTLAIIFILFILPITLLLTYYINSQIDTIAIQNSYDTKLLNATYDAIVAFELNTMNNKGYSTNAEALRRDITASINTFKTSLANNFGVAGAGANYMLPYIPAVVYTLYDGYYIYSPIANTTINKNEDDEEFITKYEHTLKPYIYYTARYKYGTDTDFIVNYSLDNYIVVYGNIKGTYYSRAGYLSYFDKFNGKITIDGEEANNYYNESKEFSEWVIANLKDVKAQDIVVEIEDSGKIVTARELTDEKNQYYDLKEDTSKIFDIKKDNDPEVKTSDFCEHKNLIIRKSIESNLNSAINNYTKQSEGLGTTYDFKMPILSPLEWDKVLSNVSIITFMQGLPVGMKTYNNYMIVSSTGNRQFVDAESLYFVTKKGEEEGTYYHRINCPLLAEELKNDSSLTLEGYSSIDFKGIFNADDEESNENGYIYNHDSYACYECIVSSKVGGITYDNEEKDENKEYFINNNDNLITFLRKYKNEAISDKDYTTNYNDSVIQKLRNAYYSSLFRERYNLVKVSQYVNGAN